MATVNQMRVSVGSAYPGQKWNKKVRKMDDMQIIALYYKLIKSGRIRA